MASAQKDCTRSGVSSRQKSILMATLREPNVPRYTLAVPPLKKRLLSSSRQPKGMTGTTLRSSVARLSSTRSMVVRPMSHMPSSGWLSAAPPCGLLPRYTYSPCQKSESCRSACRITKGCSSQQKLAAVSMTQEAVPRPRSSSTCVRRKTKQMRALQRESVAMAGRRWIQCAGAK